MLIHGRRLLKVGFWEAGLTWSFNTRSREPWPRHRILSEGGPVYVCSSRGHGVRSGHGRSQPDGLVAREGPSLDPPRRDARELISRKIPRARDEPAELNLERCLGLRSCPLAVADLDLDGFPAHRFNDHRGRERVVVVDDEACRSRCADGGTGTRG